MKHFVLIIIFLSSIAANGQQRIIDSIRPASVQRKIDSFQTVAVAVIAGAVADISNKYTTLANTTAASIANIQQSIGTMATASSNLVAGMDAMATTVQGQLDALFAGRIADSIRNAQLLAVGLSGKANYETVAGNTNAINYRVKYSDTAGMFAGYVRNGVLAGYLPTTTAASTYYPLNGNPSGYLLPAALAAYTPTSTLVTGYPSMVQFNALKALNDSLRTVTASQANQIASLTATNGTLPAVTVPLSIILGTLTYTIPTTLGYAPSVILYMVSDAALSTMPVVSAITTTSFKLTFTSIAANKTFNLTYVPIK